MKKLIFLLVLFINLISSQFAFSQTKTVTVSYYNNWPPYSDQLDSGKTEGILVDIVRIALSHTDLQSEAVSFPQQQAQALVNAKIIDAFVAIINNNSPENITASIPIFTVNSKAFVFKKNPNLNQLKKLSSIKDLKKFNICADQNDLWAKQQFKNYSIKALLTKTQTECFRQIALGRYDVIITAEEVGNRTLTAMGLKKYFLTLPHNYRSRKVALMVKKDSELAALLPKFNSAIKDIHKDNVITKIIAAYTKPAS